MPTMANITVKKADGTTDVIYVALAPSNGDQSPARWRLDAIGGAPANRPVLTVGAKAASNGATRVVFGKFVFPETFTDTTTGITSVRSSASGSFEVRVPQHLAPAIISEFSAQFGNLVAASLMKSSYAEGYAPQ